MDFLSKVPQDLVVWAFIIAVMTPLTTLVAIGLREPLKNKDHAGQNQK